MLKCRTVLLAYPQKCLFTGVNTPLISTTPSFFLPQNSLWQQQLEVSSCLRQNLSTLNFLSSRLLTHAVRSLLCVCLLSLGLGFQVHLVMDHIFFLAAVFGEFSVFIVP